MTSTKDVYATMSTAQVFTRVVAIALLVSAAIGKLS